MGLKVDIAALEAAAQSVAREAQGAQAVAGEVSVIPTGSGPVDAALGNLIKGWAAQLLALSEVSNGMASNLESSAARYTATDQANAQHYGEPAPKHPGSLPDPSGTNR